MDNPIARIKALVERWRSSRAGRSLERFGAAGGGVMSGGIAYTALFSLFALLAIGFTVLLGLLGADQKLLDAVVTSVNTWVPGLLAGPDGKGLIDPHSLILAPALSIAGAASIVVLAWSALALSRGLRSALGAIGERPPAATSFVRGLVRDVGLIAALGLALVATSGLQLLAWEAGPALAGLAGGWRTAATIGLRVLAFVLAAAADGAVIAYLLWPFTRAAQVEDGADDTEGAHDGGPSPASAPSEQASTGTPGPNTAPPLATRRDVLWAAITAGLVFGVVRLLGVSVVTGSGANPLLAPFAALVTLLAWVNLNSRTVLLAAAWVTTAPSAPQAARRG